MLKRGTVVAHDLAMTALALALSIFLRWPLSEIAPRLSSFLLLLPPFMLYAAVVYRVFSLYQSKWRFASLPDLYNIFRAATVLALSLLALDYALVARGLVPNFLFGEKAVFLYWVMQMFLLGGPRLAYRYLKYVQSRRAGEAEDVASVILLGRATEVEVVLRALESGLRHRYVARAILSPRETDLGIFIRGVPVSGDYGDLERVVGECRDNNLAITKLIFAPSEFTPDQESERLVATARRLGITLLRMQTLEDDGQSPALAPVEIEDLLFRPSVEVDRKLLASFLAGKRVVVTGGGGSIGSEICHRVAAFGAMELMVLDNSEPALHGVLESLAGQNVATHVEGVIADIRDRDRLVSLFQRFRPDVVFHAAALKQLPFLERDWSEGVKTNIFGTANVIEAAAGAKAVVTISTDKAVDPVSVLGATKRFSEIYAQMADAEEARKQSGRRIISVRFGNVLGSVGSVVPKFKQQIARGGPVTVTHPDMVRYFMTVREACDLVLTASAHALAPGHETDEAASVYVLKMGQPAKIVDLARRMIRLAGFEPGRDIEIVFTGTRQGERLNEYLFAADEPAVDIGVDGVTAAKSPPVERARILRWMDGLSSALSADNRAAAEQALADAIPAFRKSAREAQIAAEAAQSAKAAEKVADLGAARRAALSPPR